MKKCSICGRRFRLLAENRYEVKTRVVERTIYYNAFDCPHCGCQNIVGVVEKTKVVKGIENDPQAYKESDAE